MSKVYFLFGVHNHQPVGNFDYVFEDAFSRCYAPFIDILERYPLVKCNLHITGPLYDWIISHRRHFMDKIKAMVKKGQLEIISGGYYEPILPIIPDEDKYSQIELMNKFIKNQFNKNPTGIWIAERVWEPYLARVIHDSSLRYTFLDDTHFRYAGLSEKEFLGYYTTEDAGKEIFIFPISKTLRYKIPFSQAHEAIELLKSFANNGDTLITLFDDGEKFGLWPHTFDWVYNKGWLDSFFKLLTKNINTVETITAQEAIEKFSPNSLVYLPTASYEEMGEWVLEPAIFRNFEELQKYITDNPKSVQWKSFLRGGFFRNFSAKYPRINFMHKKMVFLSNKIHAQRRVKDSKNILKHLWQAQCNCGYWHGIFGGFYLGHIRAAIYENLIKAEKEFDTKTSKNFPIAERRDFNFDGYEEITLKNRHLILTLSEKGATIVELSYKDKCLNLLNTITRQEESYHSKVSEAAQEKGNGISTIHDVIRAKEKGLENYLIYDNYEKVSLIDNLLRKDISLEDFSKQKKVNTLSNFRYQISLSKRKSGISLSCRYKKEELDFLKKVSFANSSSFDVEYMFFKTALLEDYYFGVEFNIYLPSKDSVKFLTKRESLSFNGSMALDSIDSLGIKDSFTGIEIQFNVGLSDVFITPLYSVSSSEAGFEKAYQQATLLFIKKERGDSYRVACRLKKEG